MVRKAAQNLLLERPAQNGRFPAQLTAFQPLPPGPSHAASMGPCVWSTVEGLKQPPPNPRSDLISGQSKMILPERISSLPSKESGEIRRI